MFLAEGSQKGLDDVNHDDDRSVKQSAIVITIIIMAQRRKLFSNCSMSSIHSFFLVFFRKQDPRKDDHMEMRQMMIRRPNHQPL